VPPGDLGLPGEHSEANWLPTQVREATNTLFHLANTRWNRVCSPLFIGRPAAVL
jgi:hypothetical protein